MKKRLLFTLLLALYILFPAFSQAQAVAAGVSHSLGICPDGTVQSWGRNIKGQLGIGNTLDTSKPVPVNLVPTVATVGGGTFSLFLKSDSTVWACGWNFHGQLGDGTTTDRWTPIQVHIYTDVAAIACGRMHSLFLMDDGTVWGCGANFYYQLGDGTTTDRYIPIQLNTLTDITAIAAGVNHSFFVKSDGTVWACGQNNNGQLGDGTNIDRSTPVQITSLTDVVAAAGGWGHSLFLKNDGTVWACGSNGYGQLGDNTTTDKWTPVQVSNITDVVAIACGDAHSLFLKSDGSVYSCGQNTYGQLGIGNNLDKKRPTQLNSLSDIIGIAGGGGSVLGGGAHSLFLKNDSTVWSCGYNFYGQIGDSTQVNRSTPVQVSGLCEPVPTLLPVRWVSFTAKPVDQVVDLEWVTGSESNVQSFTVERSTDGKRFNPIASIPAAGNTSGALAYSFVDEHPFSGTDYYRLKERDFNGHVEYSLIVKVKVITGQSNWSLSPIPAKNTLNIEVSVIAGQSYTLLVTDPLGRQVLSRQIFLTAGMNHVTLDISGLNSGYHLISLIGRDINMSQGFIKN